MPRKQNPEQSVADVIAEGGPPKARSFGASHFHLVGRIATDGELRYTPTGKAVLHLTVATNLAGKAEFHDCVAWERAAEVLATYARKGREVDVEGRVSSRPREIEGHRIRQVDLVVENFQLLGRPTGGDGAGEQAEVAGAA
jgi:single-strand DNA-binding protein